MTKIEHLSDSVTLYLGDCRDVLPSLGAVDAVVTDPPYGVGFDYGAAGHDDATAQYESSVVARVLATEGMLTPLGVMCVFQSAIHAPRCSAIAAVLGGVRLGIRKKNSVQPSRKKTRSSRDKAWS